MKKILLLFFILFQISLFAQISDLNNCAGNNVFDLTSQEAILIGSQNPADLIITYHVSLADAQNNVNAIANPTSYTSVSSAETIYVRVENTNTTSVGYETFNLIENYAIVIDFLYLIDCMSGVNIQINATGGGGNFTYDVNNPDFNGAIMGNLIYGLQSGANQIIVTDQFGCTSSINVFLEQFEPLSVSLITNGNTITLNTIGGTPPYQYSISTNPTEITSNNTFENLPPGYYCFYVQDQFGCVVSPTCLTIVDIIDLNSNGTYQDYNNDGFVNVGDVITYTFSVTNTQALDLTNIALDAFGLSTNGTTLATLSGGATDTTTFTATYVLTQEDINTGYVTREFLFNGTYDGNSTSKTVLETTTLAITDGIKLNAFLDSNGNNIQDNGEPNINVGSFEYQINNGNTISIETSNGMYYLYETNASNTYNINYTINSTYQDQFTVTQNNYTNITVPVNSGVTTYNFPILGDYSPDLQVFLNQFGAPPRPGFVYYERIMYRNSGNMATNGTITFTKDAIVSITNVSEPGFVTNTNGFSYNFTNLLPNETRYIYVTMQTPTIPTVALGDLITNSVTITLPTGDINPNNNEATLSQVVVGSYDPNDKTEVHGGKIVHANFTSSDYLTYTIQFENTGTANAINVKVDDVLDAMLDVATLKMIDASHDYVLIKEGNNLSWKFDGIDLPPSVANTTTGKGYIVFQIKPMSGYAIGDIIPNTAEIYFDFNPAIVTNTFTTEFVETLGVSDFKKNDFVVYPNPATNELFIHSNKNDTLDAVVLVDALGKTIYQEVVKATFSRIDISSFQKGIYFLKVTHNGYEETLKVIKQ
ncbi:conserved exported hypothetical protein [Flavobacterium sp. 9AF]|uniref:T9SS type A sorting domain-containing protein n=1 Tax=Flavobacterium sp. 9AF TaxID=2653142 RepID=UPI0012F0BA04|nr:T9SS type A sorting domain-containing protein [Flavobacterium sp. 9AF]VXB12809.1 conserved exported hypothetical protein [Flavobacterium sp. 9AF]